MNIASGPHNRQPFRTPWTYERLIRERAIALGHAIESSTAHVYGSHLQSYLQFCKLQHFPIDPTPDTLSFYVVYMSHHIKPASVKSYLSGICNALEPNFPDIHKNRNTLLVTKSLTRMKKL
jgi:hypothetical protein